MSFTNKSLCKKYFQRDIQEHIKLKENHKGRRHHQDQRKLMYVRKVYQAYF